MEGQGNSEKIHWKELPVFFLKDHLPDWHREPQFGVSFFFWKIAVAELSENFCV
jgi:hypothetical protein